MASPGRRFASGDLHGPAVIRARTLTVKRTSERLLTAVYLVWHIWPDGLRGAPAGAPKVDRLRAPRLRSWSCPRARPA